VVITEYPAGKTVDRRTGLAKKTMIVVSCAVLCNACRGK
jgi:hypothetical protein